MAVTSLDYCVVYNRTDDTDLLPLASPTTAIGANATSTSTGVSIGFTFTFDGVDYTTCALSARGFIRFAGTETSGTNANLFASNTNQIAAPWWDAIETAVTVGYVKHETQGTAPWRRFVVEWYCNLSDSYDGTNYVRAKFQAVLYESWNEIQFVYGARETGGSPSNTGSASIGVKGDTTSVTDNLRDFARKDYYLGGGKATNTTNLVHYGADWPTGSIRFEPSWPMVGFYIDTPLESLTGIQHPYGDPFRVFASNSNWHYCAHTPALVHAAPWHKTGTTYNNPIYVVPIEPDPDDRTYEVLIQAYQANGSPTLALGYDSAADPQPGTSGDWTSLATPTGPAGTGNQTWTAITVSIPAAATHLRLAFTSNDFRLESVIVRMQALTSATFDQLATTEFAGSGFVPVSIAQVRQQGAAVHPEFLNRCWRNAARVVLARKAALWSLVSGSDTGYGFDTTSPVRVAGCAPAWIHPTWQAQDVEVRVYAYDDDNGGLAVLAQRGGESSSFTIDSNGDEYRAQTATQTLVGNEPTFLLTADPATKIFLGAVVVLWSPNVTDEDYIEGTTPPARLEYLAALAARQRQVSLYAYPMTGLATMLRRGTSNPVYLQYQIPPHTKAMRPRVARHAGSTKGSALDTSLYGRTTSGTGGSDEIVIPNPNAEDNDAYPPEGGPISIVSGSLLYDAAPGAASDRLLESPTAGTATGSAIELLSVLYGVGLCLVPLPDDVTALE